MSDKRFTLFHGVDREVTVTDPDDYWKNGGDAEHIFLCDTVSRETAKWIARQLNNSNCEWIEE